MEGLHLHEEGCAIQRLMRKGTVVKRNKNWMWSNWNRLLVVRLPAEADDVLHSSQMDGNLHQL